MCPQLQMDTNTWQFLLARINNEREQFNTEMKNGINHFLKDS